MHLKRAAAYGVLVVIAVLLSAPSGVQADTSSTGVMIYKAGRPVDDANFVDVTSLIPALGGTVLQGNPTIRIRFDSPPDPDASTAHGIFEQRGKAKIRI